jgi:predicted ATPase
MISRILPDAMLESSDLLSLLQGRSPGSLTKDTADTLFKLMIPLQPLLIVFDAADGDGGIDSSSWCLMEQLLLSASTSCPQMIAIVISRQPLSIPARLAGITIDTSLKRITKQDSEEYIRALFDPNGVDKSMTVDENVIDIIHARANGCPLFLERLVLWAQKRAIIEIDETRNAVAFNFFHGHRSELNDVLPATLNEEILSEISSLHHNELESLKTACCMGAFFD